MKSGEKPGRSLHRSQLGSRDRRIVADVLRYRLTTNELIHGTYLPQASANAATKITSRLVSQGWLASYPLVDKRLYFVPGKSLVRLFGLPASRVKPLGPQALASHLSLANYCTPKTPRLALLDDSDISQHYPWLPTSLRTLPHVRSTSPDDTTLRLVRVDLGGTPDYLARKCRSDLTRRETVPGYASLLAARKVLFVVLTSTEIKRDLIKAAIQKMAWPATMRFHLEVVDDLFRLLGT